MIFLFQINSIQLQALPGDSNQPIEIEADFAELDDEQGETIYVGNVIVIQGSLRMTGEKLRIILDDKKFVGIITKIDLLAYLKRTNING